MFFKFGILKTFHQICTKSRNFAMGFSSHEWASALSTRATGRWHLGRRQMEKSEKIAGGGGV